MRAKKTLPQLREEHRLHNKEMKRTQCHVMVMSFQEYLAWRSGKPLKSKAINKTQGPQLPKYDLDSRVQHIPSLRRTDKAVCTSPRAMKYSGTLLKGIATMHKSNAVPVLNDEEARDLAHMRRN